MLFTTSGQETEGVDIFNVEPIRRRDAAGMGVELARGRKRAEFFVENV